MAMTVGQPSFRGFEQYAEKSGKTDTGNVDSPLDVRLRQNIQKISQNVSELKNILENIGTQFDSKQVRNQLKTKQEETNVLSKVTTDLLKEFSQSCPSDKKQQREWKVQQSRFKDMFHDVLKEYNETQKVIRVKTRTSLRESLAASGVHNIHVDDSGKFFNHSGEQVQIESIKEEVDLELIKERERELKQLESDIVDINTMFNDLATMIGDQGEEIDQIEENVEDAAKNVKDAVVELKVAVDETSSSRRKKLVLIVIVCIVLAVIVTVVLAVTL